MTPSLPNRRHGPVSKWRRWILELADLSSTLCTFALPHLEKLLFASRQLVYLHYHSCLPWLQRQICSWRIALSLAIHGCRIIQSSYLMPLSSHGCYLPSTNSPNRSIVWGTGQRSDIPLCQSLQTPCRRRLHSRSRRIPAKGSNTASECFRHVQPFDVTKFSRAPVAVAKQTPWRILSPNRLSAAPWKAWVTAHVVVVMRKMSCVMAPRKNLGTQSSALFELEILVVTPPFSHEQ